VRYTFDVTHGQAMRVSSPPPEWCPDAKMGRTWWRWLPYVRWNGGRFTRDQVVAVTATWLCFWVSVTFSTVRSVREELADMRRRLDVLEGKAPVATRAVIYREQVRRVFGGDS
jgi:hypothetical protein